MAERETTNPMPFSGMDDEQGAMMITPAASGNVKIAPERTRSGRWRGSVFCVVLTIAASVVGCEQSTPEETRKEPPAAAEPRRPIVAHFDCDTMAVSATFHDDRVVLDLPKGPLTLPQVISASGARYSDDVSTFWNKGREATLIVDGQTEMCRERRDPWQEASDRGVDFRAVGQEPGWFLEIDTGQRIRLVYDYAEHEIVTPWPSPTLDGTAARFDAATRSHTLQIVIHDRPCHDSMSGEEFPKTVAVTLDDRRLHGCGRDVTSAP